MTRYERTVKSNSGSDVRTLKLVETRVYDDATHTVAVDRTVDTGKRRPRRVPRRRRSLTTSAGRILEVTRLVDGQEAKDKYKYTERGQVSEHTSPTGAVTTWTYDPLGNLVETKGPEGHVTAYALNAAGQVETQTGPEPGYQCDYRYDALGRLMSKTEAESKTTPEMKWTYEYFPDTHEVKETAHLGSAAKDIVTVRRFNARDRLVREQVSGPGGSSETTFALDGPWEGGSRHSEGTWEAKSEVLARDARGRILSEKESWSQDSLSYAYETSTVWSGASATLTMKDTVGGQAPKTFSAEVAVDSLGNTIFHAQGGASDKWLYDAAGVLIRVSPSGMPETTHVYENGVLKRSLYGTETVAYDYYPDSSLKQQFDASGRETKYEYYPRGLIKSVSFGKGQTFEKTSFEYDGNGSRTKVTYADGSSDAKSWSYGYGPRGELQSVTQPTGGVFEYQYDPLLRLTEVRAPSGTPSPVQQFAYDFAGRQTMRKRGTNTWQTAWTNGEGVTTGPPMGTDAAGAQLGPDQVATLLDGRGRVAKIRYLPGAASAPQTEISAVTYQYDAADQLLQADEARGATSVSNVYGYDARRLLTSITRGGDSVAFTYTASGQRQTLKSSVGGGDLSYEYDDFGRLQTLVGPRGRTNFEWESGGDRLLAIKDDSLVERRCYDDRGRLVSVTNSTFDSTCGSSLPTGLHSRFEYTYDGRGNRRTETYRDALLSGSEVSEFSYDDSDRLQGVLYGNGASATYSIAEDGTRTGETFVSGVSGESPVRREYRFDTAGGLKSLVDPDQAGATVASFVTDPLGRLTAEVRSTERRNYAWDGAGRLASVSVQPVVAGGGAPGVTTIYSYGFDGLRRSRTVNGATTGYLWAGEELLEERLPGNTLHYENASGLTVAAGGQRIAHDGLGSAVGQVGPTDTHQRYDAFGGFRTGQPHWTVPGSAQASIAFTGYGWDGDAGLLYAQQRWYDPRYGRFLSEDPVFGQLSNPSSLNSWLYANGNPTSYVDPNGRFANLISGAIGTVVGGVAGCAIGAWNAEYGDRAGACMRGGFIGAAAGAMAGLTFGLATAAGGSALFASTLAGGASTYGSVYLTARIEYRLSSEEANTRGAIAAPFGMLGGALGHWFGGMSAQLGGATSRASMTGGQRLLATAAAEFGGGFSGDAASQLGMIASGAQEEFDLGSAVQSGFFQTAIGTGLSFAPDALRKLNQLGERHPRLNPANYRLPGTVNVGLPIADFQEVPTLRIKRNVDRHSSPLEIRDYARKKRLLLRYQRENGAFTFAPNTSDVRISSMQSNYRNAVASRFERRFGVALDLSRLDADHGVDLIAGGSPTQRLQMRARGINKSFGAQIVRQAEKAGLREGQNFKLDFEN